MSSVLLFSGGMDSVAMAAWKRPDLLLTIDYGQRPAVGEVRAAKVVAECLELSHEVLKIDCTALGSGDLAGIAALTIAPASDWWPYRNQLLITIAASRALSLSATELMIATVRSDGVHADGRREFIDLIDRVLAIQEGGLRLISPAIDISTAELVRKSGIDSTTLAWAHSCHVAAWSCGQCRGCNKRFEVWQELGYE